MNFVPALRPNPMPDEFNPLIVPPRTDSIGAVPPLTADFGTVPQRAESFGNLPHPSEGFGKVPQTAETFRTVPNTSEPFGTVPHATATVRTMPKPAEPLPPTDWRERYTLTVRETARLFETAGVARSERSIVNWCQKNRQGIARLDAYYDPNERRYFITRQSADSIIAEEKARAAKNNAEPVPHPAEEFGSEARPDAEGFRKVPNDAGQSYSKPAPDSAELAELRKENLDLKITNRGKDYFIEQLQKEREGLLKQVVDSSQRVGQLETEVKLLSDHSER
jgi:hypothetical protein